MPKQITSERFDSTLENIRYDLKLKSFTSKHKESNTMYNKDNFQNTKLDILISNSNIGSDIPFKSDLNKPGIHKKSSNVKVSFNYLSKENSNKHRTDSQLKKKITSNKISENTKKLLTKCYEIDLVSIASLNNNNNDKKMVNTSVNKKYSNNSVITHSKNNSVITPSKNNSMISNNNNTINTILPRSSSFTVENVGLNINTSTATIKSNARRNFNIIENIKRQGG